MQISVVTIKNWRSVRDVQLRLGGRTALVGENNAGKSNLLAAVNHVLGERWPSNAQLSADDFPWRDTASQLLIDLEFTPNDRGISNICYQWPYEAGDSRTVIWESGAQTWLNNEIRGAFPAVLVTADRTARSQLNQSAFSLLGRVLERLHTSLDDPTNAGRREAAMAAFGEVEAQLNTEQYAQFHDVARESFADLLIGTGYNLALQFRPYDPTNLYRGVRPLIRELGIERDVSEMGDGVSNLAVLALFRAYAEVLRGTGILMIEEPETWLHPQAQRALSSTIDRMAESGIQLVITTHSPAFIQPERFDEVVVCGETQRETIQRSLNRYRPLNWSKFVASGGRLSTSRKTVFENGSGRPFIRSRQKVSSHEG